MSAATQVSIENAATGRVMRDYISVSGAQTSIHIASMHNTKFAMNNTDGTLSITRGNQEVFRANIMNVSALAGATAALRFTDLANSLGT